MSNNDKHHIWPRSIGGSDAPENIAKVNKKKHAIYHILFCNLSPPQIIGYLVTYWWNDNWSYVEQALERRHQCTPFGDMSDSAISSPRHTKTRRGYKKRY